MVDDYVVCIAQYIDHAEILTYFFALFNAFSKLILTHS